MRQLDLQIVTQVPVEPGGGPGQAKDGIVADIRATCSRYRQNAEKLRVIGRISE